jgi:hypothetical protein
VIVYKVLCKNYELKQDQLMGALAERRKDLRGKSRVESGLKWARLVFGQMVRDKQAIFVVPHELNLKDNTITPVEKKVFSKEESFWMLRGLN